MDRKEYMKAYLKEWREKNKERLKEYQKEYREKNKEKIKESMKVHYKTPAGKKLSTIKNWKKSGLINEDYDALYQKYIESTNCEECGCEYGKYGDGSLTFRCMDHSHITGLFRNFLCQRCNITRG